MHLLTRQSGSVTGNPLVSNCNQLNVNLDIDLYIFWLFTVVSDSKDININWDISLYIFGLKVEGCLAMVHLIISVIILKLSNRFIFLKIMDLG